MIYESSIDKTLYNTEEFYDCERAGGNDESLQSDDTNYTFVTIWQGMIFRAIIQLAPII